MAFKPLSTKDALTAQRKVLLYAHHGWGKTTQMKFYQEHYGPGFIISGEAGLSSIRSANIDYLPFSSWDGEVDEAKGIYSFRSICKTISSPEFQAMGYKWIGLDSLTELGDHCFAAVEAKYNGDKKNGFAIWGEYATSMIGACKWVRDLPTQVIVTCLAKEESNDNGDTEYWPFVKGNSVQKQLPGIFDAVFAGVRHTAVANPQRPAEVEITRYIVTEEVKGWHGKVRDENKRLKPIERTGNVVSLLKRLDMTNEEFEKFSKSSESNKE